MLYTSLTKEEIGFPSLFLTNGTQQISSGQRRSWPDFVNIQTLLMRDMKEDEWRRGVSAVPLLSFLGEKKKEEDGFALSSNIDSLKVWALITGWHDLHSDAETHGDQKHKQELLEWLGIDYLDRSRLSSNGNIFVLFQRKWATLSAVWAHLKRKVLPSKTKRM